MPVDSLPKNLESALLRLTKGVVPEPQRGLVCRLKSQCPKCQHHRGITLENDGVFVRASLCTCVKDCPLCFGTCGISQDGRVSDCVKPSPLRIIGLVNEAKIPGRYLDADLGQFSNFSGSGKQVIAQIQRWIDNFVPGKSSGLLLTGSVGVGKTYVLCAIAKKLALRGVSVRFADFFQLLNELRDSYSAETRDTVTLKPLNEFDVLIIDELGKGRNSEWEVSIADSLISDRYNGNKSVIASTNYALKESANDLAKQQMELYSSSTAPANQMNTDTFETLVRRLGPRIYSRLKEMTVFLELTGDDCRRH